MKRELLLITHFGKSITDRFGRGGDFSSSKFVPRVPDKEGDKDILRMR